MPRSPNYGNLDVKDFTVGAMLRAGIAIRRVVRGSQSLEGAADVITRYLYEHCVDPNSGVRSCPLVRFYKTHRYADLESGLKAFAARQLDSASLAPDMRCLTLLATAGDEPAWNDRRTSEGHQAIPLPSADFVRQAPMIARLIEGMGLDIESVVKGTGASPRPGDTPNYDVFHVEDARDSPHIPAQDFVRRYDIRSVVGFGGLLRSSELFAMILFSRETIPASSAARFKTIALDVRSSLFALDETKTWAVSAIPARART